MELGIMYAIGCVIMAMFSFLFQREIDFDIAIALTFLWPILLPYFLIRTCWRGFRKLIK